MALTTVRLHDAPLNVFTPPWLSPATQNDGDAHDTELSAMKLAPPSPGKSTATIGGPQPVPL